MYINIGIFKDVYKYCVYFTKLIIIKVSVQELYIIKDLISTRRLNQGSKTKWL